MDIVRKSSFTGQLAHRRKTKFPTVYIQISPKWCVCKALVLLYISYLAVS